MLSLALPFFEALEEGGGDQLTYVAIVNGVCVRNRRRGGEERRGEDGGGAKGRERGKKRR